MWIKSPAPSFSSSVTHALVSVSVSQKQTLKCAFVCTRFIDMCSSDTGNTEQGGQAAKGRGGFLTRAHRRTKSLVFLAFILCLSLLWLRLPRDSAQAC